MAIDIRLERERVRDTVQEREPAPREALREGEVRTKRLDAFAPGATARLVPEGDRQPRLLAPTTTGLAPTHTVKPIDPVRLLPMVESADLVIRMPGIAGNYGHAVTDFTVDPGTELVIRAKVRNGVVVPGEVLVSFDQI